MKIKILKLLKETDGYISGQDLCDCLNVSRTAVWKVINQLKDEGYHIEAVRNKGYRLVQTADVITTAELKSMMNTKWVAERIEYYEQTDSTNTRAKRLAEEGALHGTLVVANSQTSGKGRRGRMWESPVGTCIYMSLLLRPDIQIHNASMLTLVAALAAASGISAETGLECKIKWPNDIVVNGKKVTGILTEMGSELDCIHYIVIGIGINVNITEFPEEIKAVAGSLSIEAGRHISRSAVISRVIESFEGYYEKFIEKENLRLLMGEYNDKMAGIGNEVRVLEPGNEYTASALGIDENGKLLVRLLDGTVKEIVSGEVSVRGMHGYI